MLPYGCKGCPVVVMPYSPSALVRVSVAWRAVPRQLSHTGMMKPRPIGCERSGLSVFMGAGCCFLEVAVEPVRCPYLPADTIRPR